MTRRLLLLISLCTLFSIVAAIQYVPGSGDSVGGNELRTYHYHYHNAQNDFNFFGADKWAVRFNFQQAYPGVSSSSFSISGA
ncbi:MAG TPA: hypothetical protein PKI59_09030, partial [Candidatus Cloacimonadota bacterium]|nr:hypothetical protein [Candidatus Cloacimonadota bacterium]